MVVTAVIDAGGGVHHPHPRCLIDGDGRRQHWGSGGGCGWQWWQLSSSSAGGGHVVDGGGGGGGGCCQCWGSGGGGRTVDAGGWRSSSSMLVVVVVASVVQVVWPLVMCDLSHTTPPWVEERERERVEESMYICMYSGT